MKISHAIMTAVLLGLSGASVYASPGPALYAGWTSLYQQAQEQKEALPPPIPAPQQSSLKEDLNNIPEQPVKPQHAAPAKTR